MRKELQNSIAVFSQWITHTKLAAVENYLHLHADPEIQASQPMNMALLNTALRHLEGDIHNLTGGAKRLANIKTRYHTLLDQEEQFGVHLYASWARSLQANT